MARFPHIGAGENFPYLDRAKPYQRKTDFDYTRYDYTATAKLCSVPWPIDYRHAVAWEDADARDAYFDDLDGHTIELSQGFTRIQLDRITLDIPYDEALLYNYVYMQVPMLTEKEPIRHEGETGLRTICAFIQDCVYLSPSTTEIVLSVDMWTTYLPYLAISGLMLRRGHAPMYGTSAAAYLADPVSHCADLLTPDVNYGGAAEVVRHGEVKPLSTAEPFYVFASTIPYSDISGLAQASVTAATAPTFADTGARNGHQVTVNNYAWNTKGAPGLYNPTKPVACVDGSTPSGLYYYGVYAGDMAAGAFSAIFDKLPLLAKTTKALYVVPSDLVYIGASHTVSTFTFYEVRSKAGLQGVGSFTLGKSMFGYASEYADIAKLYTSPYATLELADDLGNVVPLRVENCHGTLDIAQHLTMAFPFLSWDAMVTNYANAGAANATYNWCKLNDGTTEARTLPNADFMEAAISYGIDTYELRLEAWPLAQIDSYFDADYQREAAIKAYQATMRSANTVLENAEDSNATANTNALESNATANTNALDSNDTANTNAHNSNDTAQHNAQASAYVTHLNATGSADNARDNATLSRNATEDRATEADANLLAMTSLANERGWADHYLTNSLNTNAFGVQQTEQIAERAVSTVANAANGNLLGAVSGALDSIIHYTADQRLLNLENSYRYDRMNLMAQNNNKVSGYEPALWGVGQQRLYSTALSEIDIDLIEDTRDNNHAAAIANADRTKQVTNDNAVRLQTAGNDNADLTKTTADKNANRTKTTSDANADRTKATADANAGYARATTEENAKNALLLAQDAYTTRIEGAGVDNPAAFGSASGDGLANSYRMRGVHLRAKTQSDAAIARAGDTFLRYGYAYDGVWELSAWCPSGHDFCYWQADDLWVSSADIANPQAERALESILEEGVTVWNDPEKIGRVRI